ncbi:MAG: glycosyltransferase [Burkholderiales bacterium]|nr:glycosyltransferase [Burkholderiales bacterium]
MALGARATVHSLKREGRCDILDAHFGYPDGYAASLLGRWLGVPFTVTFRGTEPRHAADPKLAPRLRDAVRSAQRVFAVSGSLASLAVELGAPESRTVVVGNGVDVEKFAPMDRAAARHALGLPQAAKVLVTVGGLVERKGFHRVIDLVPELAARFPDLHYLVVGGASPEGDWSERLRAQVARLGLQSRVHFLGALPPERLKVPLSAADVFVLATSNEGWANVLLEAMACGLPVVTTDVGGNAEVVSGPALGAIVPFGDRAALGQAIADALVRQWDRAALRAHAARHAWGDRAAVLAAAFRAAAAEGRGGAEPVAASQQPVS